MHLGKTDAIIMMCSETKWKQGESATAKDVEDAKKMAENIASSNTNAMLCFYLISAIKECSKLFIFNSKIIKSIFHCILTGEAGITQKALFILPVLDTPIII